MEACGVVQAADALAAVRPAHAGGQRRLHVPVALTPHTDAVRVVVALVTLVAVEASVPWLALVTPRDALTRLWRTQKAKQGFATAPCRDACAVGFVLWVCSMGPTTRHPDKKQQPPRIDQSPILSSKHNF